MSTQPTQWSRLTRAAQARGFKALNAVLAGPERWVLQRRNADAAFPALFIVGAPRSGTTLLYQVLAAGFEVGYFSNFLALFPKAPVTGLTLARLLRIQARSQPPSFQSRHGSTQGWLGPHEAGEFWYRWFPRGQHVYVAPGATSSTSLAELRQEVRGMAAAVQAPLVFMNTYNSMRLAPLAEALPEALFLVCQRNPLDIAQSIYQARLDAHGDKQAWWSVPPQEIELIRNHPYWEQIPEQIYYIHRQIEADQARLGAARFLTIHYHDLCTAPQATSAGIQRFLAQHGAVLASRSPLPASFPFSTGCKIDPADYTRLEQATAALWKH